jgi:hypothetical protein
MKFQINALSPFRTLCEGLRVTAAMSRVSANLVDLAAKGVEAVTSPEAIKALADQLAEATAPLAGVAPRFADRAARAERIEVGLRRDIHGDVPAPCHGKSRSARRRARAKARAAEAAAAAAGTEARVRAFWTEERQAAFADAFGKA